MSTPATESEMAVQGERPSRRPLVYVEPQVLRDAERLLPGVVLENLVERAILDGHVRFFGREAVVQGEGWFAVLRRERPRIRPRRRPRPWVVVSVEPDRKHLPEEETRNGT